MRRHYIQFWVPYRTILGVVVYWKCEIKTQLKEKETIRNTYLVCVANAEDMNANTASRRVCVCVWFEVNTGHKHYKICFAVMTFSCFWKSDQWNLKSVSLDSCFIFICHCVFFSFQKFFLCLSVCVIYRSLSFNLNYGANKPINQLNQKFQLFSRCNKTLWPYIWLNFLLNLTMSFKFFFFFSFSLKPMHSWIGYYLNQKMFTL